MSEVVATNIEYRFAAEVTKRDQIHKRLTILAEDYYQTCINKLILGEQVSIVVTSKKPKRTEAQNRYYWLYIGMVGHETGESDLESLHSLFKGEFLTIEIKEVLGKKVRKTKSTTELTKAEFSEYIARIETLTGVLAPDTRGYWDD